MKLIAAFILALATVLPAWSAQVFPATTNRSQILYGTNTFWTNTILVGPSLFSNTVTALGTIYATNFYGLDQVLTNNQSTEVTLKGGLQLTNCSLIVTGAQYLAVSNGTARVLLTNGNVTASGNLSAATITATAGFANAASGRYIFSGKGGLASASNGVFDLENNAATAYGTLTSAGLILSGPTAYLKWQSVGVETNVPTAGAGTAYLFAGTNDATAEVFVMDGAGNVSQISPHAIGQAPPEIVDLDDPFPHVSKEYNIYLGKVRWVNYSRGPKQQELLTKVVLNSLSSYQFLTGKSATQWTNSGAFNKYTNSLVKLDELAETSRQLVVNETFEEFNQRLNLTNGNGLATVTWTGVQERLSNEVFTAYSIATNAYLLAIAAGDTNAVDPGPYIPRQTDPIPAWLYDRGVR